MAEFADDLSGEATTATNIEEELRAVVCGERRGRRGVKGGDGGGARAGARAGARGGGGGVGRRHLG